MASNINSQSIDEEYPVAGQDNDSQGFRDNFATIKTSLAAAKAEIEDLQGKAVLKSALQDDTLDNNLQGTSIINADLQLITQKYHSVGSVGDDSAGNTSTESSPSQADISFEDGHYHKVLISADFVDIRLTGWPAAGRHAKMTLDLSADDISNDTRVVTFSGAVFKKNADYPVSLEITSFENPVIIEFWTYDGGNTVFANYLGSFT